MLVSHEMDMTNKIDPDQTPQNAVSYQGFTLFAFRTGIAIKHGNNEN